jgi:hypothetical protein
MAIKTTLTCGCELQWHDEPTCPGADLPRVGRDVYCDNCGQDAEIEEISIDRFKIGTIDLDEAGHHKAEVFYQFSDDGESDGYGYCRYGRDDGDAADYELDDRIGYATAADAEAAARRDYEDEVAELQEQVSEFIQ